VVHSSTLLLPTQAGRTAAADAAALALFAVGVARCVIVQAPAFIEALRAAMMMAPPESEVSTATTSIGGVANAKASTIAASSVEASMRSNGGADSDGSANQRARPRAL
jgi:hypothetical protein